MALVDVASVSSSVWWRLWVKDWPIEVCLLLEVQPAMMVRRQRRAWWRYPNHPSTHHTHNPSHISWQTDKVKVKVKVGRKHWSGWFRPGRVCRAEHQFLLRRSCRAPRQVHEVLESPSEPRLERRAAALRCRWTTTADFVVEDQPRHQLSPPTRRSISTSGVNTTGILGWRTGDPEGLVGATDGVWGGSTLPYRGTDLGWG